MSSSPNSSTSRRFSASAATAARRIGGDVEDTGGAADDLGEVVGRVIGEPLHQAEARAHRRRQQSEPGGGADQREALERHGNGLGVRPVGDADVHAVVFHRRIEELLEHRAQPVHLVDEQDVARLERRQQADEIARALEHRARRRPDVDPQLFRHEQGEGGLAEPRWPEEQRMVERLTPLLGRVDRDLQGFLYLGLADELVEP
jgi:hypothetical protein